MRYPKFKTMGIIYLRGSILFYFHFAVTVNHHPCLITRRVKTLDIEKLEKRYISTIARIKDTFSRITRNKSSYPLMAFKEKLEAFAQQAFYLYRDGPAKDSKVPPEIAKFSREIAVRVLYEINMILTMLNLSNEDKRRGSFIKSFKYKGEKFNLTILEIQERERERERGRINILIGQENSYSTSAKNFARENNIPWERFIDYVVKELTHIESDRAPELAERFSLRVDLDCLKGTFLGGVLDITSPYICTMLALSGKAGEYHVHLFPVTLSVEEFFEKAKEFLDDLGLYPYPKFIHK